MTEYTKEQQEEIEKKVLMYFDGWETVESLEDDTEEDSENSLEKGYASYTSEELKKVKKSHDNVNKRILSSLLLDHYESSLNQALNYTRHVVDDVESFEDYMKDLFYQAVYKLTASNLWKLFNVRIDSDEEEATWKDSYGGILYIQSMKELEQFKIEFNAAVEYIADD